MHSEIETSIHETKEFYRNREVSEGSIASAKHPDRNDDTVLVNRYLDLYAVLDGVGWNKGGDIASRTAADAIQLMYIEVLGRTKRPLSVSEERDVMRVAMETANSKVRAKAKSEAAEKRDAALNKMATTVSAVRLIEGKDGAKKAVIGHVGDSRVYHFSAGSCEQLTTDDDYSHVLFRDKVKRQAVQAEIANATSEESLSDEARELFESRNVITNSVGAKDKLYDSQVLAVDVRVGDFLVITSDGIHGNLTEIEIAEILKSAQTAEEAKAKLIAKALEVSEQGAFRSKEDDISGVVIKC